MLFKRLLALTFAATLVCVPKEAIRAQCEGPDEVDFCNVDSARLETLLTRFPCLANRQVDEPSSEFGGDQCAPLLAAIKCGRTEIVRMLLEHGSLIDMSWGAVVSDTDFDGRVHLYQLDRDPVWEAFADRNSDGKGNEISVGDTMMTLVLEWASKHPRQIGVDTSLFSMFSRHKRDFWGREQFLLSVQEVLDSCLSSPDLFTDSALIRLLISSGGKMKTRSKDWISIAIDKDSPELLKFWIYKGASINYRDRNGDTPLYKAKMELQPPDLGSASEYWDGERYRRVVVGGAGFAPHEVHEPDAKQPGQLYETDSSYIRARYGTSNSEGAEDDIDLQHLKQIIEILERAGARE
jgi:Ankyrin repeats (many copies)